MMVLMEPRVPGLGTGARASRLWRRGRGGAARQWWHGKGSAAARQRGAGEAAQQRGSAGARRGRGGQRGDGVVVEEARARWCFGETAIRARGAAADKKNETKTKSYMRTQIRSLRTDRTRWSNDRTRWCSVRSQSSKLLDRPDASS
jgi:hypothetical protein